MASVRHLGLFPTKVFDGPCLIKDAKELPEGPDTATGPGTRRPIGMSLANVMALYWRVKSWKFVHTHTDEEIIVPAAFEPGAEPEDEKGLVCGYAATANTRGLITQTMSNNSDPLENGQYSFAVFEIFNFYQKGPFILKKDNLFYPTISVAWETNEISIAPNQGDYSMGSTSIQRNGDVQFGEQEIVLLEDTYSIPLYFSETVDEVDGSEFFYAGGISVHEYWEYDPKDGGGPIYDKQTGKQIRAFPS